MKKHFVSYIISLFIIAFVVGKILVLNEQTWGIYVLYGLSGWAIADIYKTIWNLIFDKEEEHGETD